MNTGRAEAKGNRGGEDLSELSGCGSVIVGFWSKAVCAGQPPQPAKGCLPEVSPVPSTAFCLTSVPVRLQVAELWGLGYDGWPVALGRNRWLVYPPGLWS